MALERRETTGLTDDDLLVRLRSWAAESLGEECRITEMAPMPGNAGLSFGFTVVFGGESRRFVLRLAPPGVRREGSTDVLRQVPLLKALAADGAVPVPEVTWSGGDGGPFGTDALIVARVAGRPYHMTDAALSIPAGPSSLTAILQEAAGTLVRIHAFRWRERLANWESVASAKQEVARWAQLNSKFPEERWRSAGSRIEARLLDTLPSQREAGLLHGDFHLNNLVLDGDCKIAAVVDWELAGIGPRPLDLGWLLMWSDELCWADDFRRRLRIIAPAAAILDSYEAAGGTVDPAIHWYEALACYRFGAIAAFNTYLHRAGRRFDPFYESLETSVMALFGRSNELIQRGSL